MCVCIGPIGLVSMLAAKAMGADAVIMTGKVFILCSFYFMISNFYIIKILVNRDLILLKNLELLMSFWLIVIHKKQLII